MHVLCSGAGTKVQEMFDSASGVLGYNLLEKCCTSVPKDVLDSTVIVARHRCPLILDCAPRPCRYCIGQE